MLFSITKLGYETTWIKKYGLDSDNHFVLYIYSFYFAATTIFTVGYGDLSPANVAEVATVVLVEICGILALT